MAGRKRLGKSVSLALVLATSACGSDGGDNGDSGGNGPSLSTTPGCKRGVAWPGRELTDARAAGGLSWWYNWSTGSAGSVAGVTFEPMVRADGDLDARRIRDAKQAGAEYLLGFNEPNFFEQADLSAAQAAALWPGLEAVADAEGLGLVSPAVNFCGNDADKTGPCHDTNPMDYLSDFFAACSGCRVDFVAVHWYNCDTDSLKWYLGEFKKFGRPIWLTEFACAYGGDRSIAGQERYMREAIPVLEDDPDVFRYAWFSASPIPEAELFDASDRLTSLGQVYVQLPHNAACD